MIRVILLFLFLSHLSAGTAQLRIPDEFSFDGLVYGYHNDPTRKFFSDKEIALEGVLEDVQIKMYVSGRKVWEGKTRTGGGFEGVVPLGKVYKVNYSKKGYAEGSFVLDLKNIPDKIASGGLVFVGLELILNSYIDEKSVDPSVDFGKLYYNKKHERFEFEPSPKNKKNIFVKRDHANTPLDLMNGSIKKNRKKNTATAITKDAPLVDHSNQNANRNEKDLQKDDSLSTSGKRSILNKTGFNLQPISTDGITQDDIKSRESEIAKAWEQLKKDKELATTPEELRAIEARENLLIAAEKDLNKAKRIIELQTEKIDSQRSIIYLFIVLAVILLAFLIFVFWTYREKLKTSRVIRKKNELINHSINYASRIQQSILLPDVEIKKIFPESFVYYKPRDIVSGDFYWFAEIEKKKIVAAVDCTGHGVPGAFMSMIANTVMNQVIREKRILDAGQILEHLHKEIIASLRQEVGNPRSNQDGMDMAICLVDTDKNELDFGGAMNPVYLLHGDKIEVLKPVKTGIGGTIASRKMQKMGGFDSKKISYKPGSSLYLFSDGYMDQFGGKPRQKFNRSRFEEMLKGIKDLSMDQQMDEVNKTFEKWKGEEEQLDDVCVIGVRV